MDGQAHTVTVTDLSDSGVKTSIRYGTEADDCDMTSAPNYTDAGYYPVYYEIEYSCSGEMCIRDRLNAIVEEHFS